MTMLAQPMMRDGAAVASAIGILKQRLGERLQTGETLRQQHGHTTTWIPNQPPDAVAFVETTPEAAEILEICAKFRVPVIPFGTGTSLEGHVNAPAGGICVDTSRMNKVLAVRPEDLDCSVEAGVTRKALNDHLRDSGLFFPIDPGADASLGGMASTRASGTNAVRYGTMKDNILNLTVVLADGRIIRTAGRAKKTSAGYDLTRLMIGSEGTLGLITELTLRLQGRPEAVSGGVCPFPSVEAACEAVILTIQSGIPVARIELLDALQMKASNAYSKLDYPETPALFIEFHGSQTSVAEDAQRFGDIVEAFGGGPFSWTTRTEERSQLWQARHDAYWAALQLRPGAKGISTDVCVPISNLASCIAETRADLDDLNLPAPMVGHVGDGNFHVLILVDPESADERNRVEVVLDRLARRAIAMEGTCTGEHGIGQGKMKYLEREMGEGVDLMRAIKKALDPLNVMNPGKIVAV